ncbi:MAG: long-chain fatty acid--CoA ligase [Candidatus Nanopelagicales bacterium]|jgi:long-chain acyl-CoA synthetase|nr:long-chain fatty acid--CoA ligase [Candidatus Nanopelagicales bacterium]MCU0297232.1 long-chain fatty acid--CoA ligase [Candidatus Nanopelagicales bacterium]
MREVAEAPLAAPITSGGLTDSVVEHAKNNANRVALRRRVGETWTDVTSAQFSKEVQALAKGLIAAGIKHGDRIAIMSATRYEWTLADYAGWFVGATVVPIYETSSAEQVEWILGNADCVGVFLETDKHKAVFDEVADRVPTTHVWIFEHGAVDDLVAAGADVPDDEVESRRSAVGPDDIATIIYTSGTTGRPKGCVLTHSNIRFETDNVVGSMPDLFDAHGSTLLFIPLAHVFGRVIQIGCIESGTVLGHTSDVKNIVELLGGFQPTFLLSVPRVFEKVFNSAQMKATAEGKGRIFDMAAATAIDYSKSLDTGGPGLPLKVKHFIFDKLVYGKLRSALGGKVEYAVSGGAPLGARLGHFFRGIGVTILEGYGLTETSAASTINLPDAIRIGTVGRPMPGASVKIADDGEILLHGGQIFQGYWKNEKATDEVLEKDGWFHSGDIGELDNEGFLKITGRKKELIVTAGGKNVAPAVLEDRIRANLLVSQCMVVGDNKPFIAALITLDVEALPSWLEQHNKPADTPLDEVAKDPEVVAAVQAAVDDANKAVSNAEAIKKFHILGVDWTEEGGQLTPSMKLKRNVVMGEFSDEVEALYS